MEKQDRWKEGKRKERKRKKHRKDRQKESKKERQACSQEGLIDWCINNLILTFYLPTATFMFRSVANILRAMKYDGSSTKM